MHVQETNSAKIDSKNKHDYQNPSDFEPAKIRTFTVYTDSACVICF